MAKTVEQAALDALATFLESELTDVVVRPYWAPPSREKPGLAVTITRVGKARQLGAVIAGTVPTVSRALVPPDPLRREFRFDVDMLEVRIQIDCWADRAPDLDSLEAGLATALRRGTLFTLDQDDVDNPDNQKSTIRDGALLRLDPLSGHDGLVDFNFDDESEINQSADSVQRDDHRATLLGSLTVGLSIWAETPVMAQIILSQKTGKGPLGSAESEEHTIEEA